MVQMFKSQYGVYCSQEKRRIDLKWVKPGKMGKLCGGIEVKETFSGSG